MVAEQQCIILGFQVSDAVSCKCKPTRMTKEMKLEALVTLGSSSSSHAFRKFIFAIKTWICILPHKDYCYSSFKVVLRLTEADWQDWNVPIIFFVPHLSAFFDTLRVLLVKLKAFLWAPKKDFTPLCSKGVKFFFATATFFFATANFFLPTVVSTSSKKKVAVPQAVLIVPTLQWSRCFASKKYVVSSYMKLTLIHGIWNRNEDFIIFC